MTQKQFRPDGETLRQFMLDRESRVKIITGPVGSGTSSACCMHIYQQALEQPEQIDGKKRFRAHVLRDTYPKLIQTTIKTWLDWFPEDLYGDFRRSQPLCHQVRVGNLELEVFFVALDDISDAEAFFKSLETSIIFINEARFTDLSIIREAVDRVQPPRYPAVKDGGCAWGGLIMDSNAPPSDHWIPIMRGDVPVPDYMTEEQADGLKKPDTWKFYKQPAGLIEQFDDQGALIGYKPNPNAENLNNLPPNFYIEKIHGQTKSWIDANIMNVSAVQIDGKPVYPHFRREAHVAEKPLEVVPGVNVTVGLDFGRQPAAVIGQCLRGDWFIQREFLGNNMSATEFAPMLKKFLAQEYPGFRFNFWGDPAGGYAGQTSDRTPFQIFNMHGMMVRPAPVLQNRQSIRQEAVNSVLLRRSQSGRASCLQIDKSCSTLITGLEGGYHYRRVRVSGERYTEEAEKNQYSHPCESMEYMMVGGGEGRAVVHGSKKPKPRQTKKKGYNPLAKRTAMRVG